MRTKNLFFSIAFFLVSFAYADIPEYRNGIDANHKIEKVIVFSDRAQVIRKAYLNATQKGRRWIHFSGLPAALDKKTVRVKTGIGRIEQVLLEDLFEHKSLEPALAGKLKELRSLFAVKLDLLQKENLLDVEYKFIAGLNFEKPFSRANYQYQQFTAPLAKINQAIDVISKERMTSFDKLEDLRSELTGIDRKIDLIKRQIQNSTSNSNQSWNTHLYVLVDGEKAFRGDIQVSYMINNAKWYPVYDVRAKLNRTLGYADIQLVTSGLVEQHTGENWDEVNTSFSAMEPITLFLPQLTRWVFAEQRVEESAKIMNDSLGGMDSGVALNHIDLRKQKSRSLQKVGFAGKGSYEGSLKRAAMPNMAIHEDRAMSEKESEHIASQPSQSQAPLQQRPVSNLQYAFTKQPLEIIFNDLQNVEQQVGRLASAVQTRQYDLSPANLSKRFQAINYRDAMLPAALAKGRKIELKSPFAVTLKNDENPIKVPIGSQRLKGELKYFAIPKKDKRVFVSANVINGTDKPLLAGNAQVFMDGDLLSKTNLNTVAENSHFSIALGIDKNITTNRIVTKKSEKEGLVFKDHATLVEVKIEIANHNNFPVQLELKDHYPRTPRDEIKVELKSVSPQAKVEEYNHVLNWDLQVPKRGKSEIVFSYRVTHPENYIVSELD